MNPHCECPLGAGFCSRHQVNKGARQVELCKGIAHGSQSCGKTYWLAWERDAHARGILDSPVLNPTGFDCNGPHSPIQSRSQPAVHDGPGNELHKILLEHGYDIQPGCSCTGMMLRMNLWGSEGTRLNREKVIDTMYAEFKRRRPIISKVTELAGKVAGAVGMNVVNPTELIREQAAEWVDEALRRWDEKQKANKAQPNNGQPRTFKLAIPDDIPVVAVVAPRDKQVHARTFKAARAAGFSRIYATCEPGTDVSVIDAEATFHEEQRGQWRNFVEALKIGISTNSTYFMTIEDDVELCSGTSDFLRRTGWPAPDCGCLSLYSASPLRNDYPRGRRSKLNISHTLDLLGACAMMFRRDAAIALVDWADSKGWRGNTGDPPIVEPDKKKAADTFVGEVLTFLKYSIWSHNPTIANHIGEESTLGHPNNSPNRIPLDFPGIEADLEAIFSEELKCVS